jgi:hypothetical protein
MSVATLATGIAACTVVFSLASAVLFSKVLVR